MTDIKAQGADGASVESGRSPSRRHRRRVSAVTVLALAAAAAIAAATADCRPTGTPVVDPLYAALLAALVTFACSRASRPTLVVFALAAVVMSRTWLEIPAVVALLIALGSLLRKHSRRRVGALIGVLGVETMVRWPSVGFHGATAAVAMAAVVPVLVSAYRRFSSAERRRARRLVALAGGLVVVLSAPFLLAVTWSRTDLAVGQRAAQTAFEDVSNGRSTSAAPPLRAADADFAARPRGSEAGGRRLPGLSPSSPSRSRRWPPAWRRPGTSWPSQHAPSPSFDYQGVNYHKGQVDLGRISAMLGPATTIDGSLTTARDRLAGLQSPWLIGPIQSRLRTFDTDLRRAQSSTDLALKAIPLVPDILGAERPQHYFLAFVSPAESRGLDGIVAAYGELTAVDGRISLTVSGPVESLDSALPAGGGRLTGQPDFIARYGSFDPAQHFQDLTYSPDFPTVAQVISQLYPQAGGGQLDGVLMLDPYGLARLLSITGPISVPGFLQPLTSENAADILSKGEYLTGSATNASSQTARHDLLQDALHITFQRLVDGSLPNPGALSRDLEPAVLNGRIAFWSTHPKDAPLVQALHLETHSHTLPVETW